MKEVLPVPEPNNSDAIARHAEAVHLADWMLRLQPPEIVQSRAEQQGTPVEELSEKYFEQRQEIKDDTQSSPAQIQPMVPIAQVIQSRSIPTKANHPAAKPAAQTTAPQNRPPTLSASTYRRALKIGIGTGIVVGIAIAVSTNMFL